MDKQRELSTLLVELDVILDTRLAALTTLNESVLDKVLKSGRYHSRIADKFESIPISAFYDHYNRRDKTTLQHAIITPIVDLMKDFVYRTIKQSIGSPYQYNPKILVNCYPYVLTKDEIAILTQTIVALTDGKADVETITASYEEITIPYLKKHIAVMVMYEYPRWLDIHVKEVESKKISCPEVGLIGPRIYFKDYDPSANHDTAFKAMEQITQPIIALQLIPVEHFSIVFKQTID